MMETCQYEQVNSSVDVNTVSKWKLFLRQLLVSSSVWISFFTMGLANGAPTVLIPQLRREANSTEAVSDEMASWMSSIHGYSGIPWIIILPILTERCGRKLPFLFVSLCNLCSFIVIYFSTSVTHIFIGEVMQGTLVACVITINIVIVTEYSSPRYRGMFLTLKSATFTWGIWCANVLGTFFHWKTIAILGLISSIYCIITTIFWTESPYWLASKGHFVKCAASHRWLKGTDEESMKELETLIESQKRYNNNVKNNKNKYSFKNTVNTMDFCKAIFLCLCVISLYHFSGKLVCTIYAIDIIKKITGNESTAYTGMLILDGVTVVGMYIGCALSKVLKRRTLLLTGSSIGILFLYLMSLYLFLINLSVIEENKYITISFLSIFSMSMCSGPMLMSSSIYGEIIPLKFRSFSLFVVGLYNVILVSSVLKLAPSLFKNFKAHGAFLFYGIMSTMCTIILYKYLPETKDKTLQEIEDVLKNGNKKDKKELMLINGSVNLKIGIKRVISKNN